MPARTAAGNLSLKKVTQAARADFYQQFLYGQILVTLRTAFALAPELISARVVVLRNDGRDPYGRPVMPCLAAVNVARQALVGVRWDDVDAVDILNATAHESLINQKGRSKELAPIDLTTEPVDPHHRPVLDPGTGLPTVRAEPLCFNGFHHDLDQAVGGAANVDDAEGAQAEQQRRRVVDARGLTAVSLWKTVSMARPRAYSRSDAPLKCGEPV
ncbi:MAG TPA: hypothetical protein VI011_25555 [Asanoa sp.]